MTDHQSLLVRALTADDRLDDLARARMWSRLEDRLAMPAVRRRWPIVAGTAGLAAAAALAIVLARGTDRSDGAAHALVAPADATLTAHLGPHTRAALVGPGELAVIGAPGDVTSVRLVRGTLLAEFTGGAGRALHVEAPGMIVDVVGTLFAVEIGAHATCVSVAHGQVRATIDGRELAVAGGQTACSDQAAPRAIAPAIEQALAKHEAILALEEAPAPAPVPVPVAVPVPAVAAAPSEAPMTTTPPTTPTTTPPTPRPAPTTRPEPAASPEPTTPPEPTTSTSTVASTSTSPSTPTPTPTKTEAPPTADELYRAAETALGRHDDAAADRILAQLIRSAPTSPLAGQAIYDRARIAYQRRDWRAARAALAELHDPLPSLAEPGHYLTCRIAVEAHDEAAARCLADYRAAYPESPHDRDVLGTLAQLAYARGGCAAAARHVDELARRHPHSALAAAWRDKCREAP